MKLDFPIPLSRIARILPLSMILFLGPAAGTAVPAPTAVQDPLDQLNAAFRRAYAQAKADRLARGGPVVLVAGDQVLLFRHNAQVDQATFRQPLFHRLKEVSHVPLVLHLLLSGPVPGEDLQSLRGLAQAARTGLETWCPPRSLDRQRRILDTCLGLLDEAAGPAPVPPERLAAFATALRPDLLADLDDAAALELEALDQAVARFRGELGPAEWASVKVVLLGAHMPRDQEGSLQYFERLLGEAREGGRIIYAEGRDRPADGLDLLATHQVDFGMGAAFFGDPWRMHRDVLADGARRWLDAHQPAP
ncbi:MAG: hypothetical protein ABSH53_13030 [Holophaga sp.]|jgi:hypothetical protein